MVTPRAMLVVNVDIDLLADRPANIELHGLRVAHQVRRDMNLHAAMSDHPIRRQVLALEMHVDRHVIFGAASTYRRHEVDGGHATSLLNQADRLIAYKQFHDSSKPSDRLVYSQTLERKTF